MRSQGVQLVVALVAWLLVALAVASSSIPKGPLAFPTPWKFPGKSVAPSKVSDSLPADPAPLPNIGYLGGGYDIILGNPEATGSGGDPGFKNSLIFAQIYSNHTTTDQRWLIPDGVEALQQRTCSYETTITEIHGETSYSSHLSSHVSVSIPILGAFSGSRDYSTVSSSSYKDHEVMVSASAVCTEYNARITTFDAPPFTTNFFNAISRLVAAPSDSQLLQAILNTFGTHVVVQTLMGAQCTLMSSFTDENWESMSDQKVDVSLGAKGSFLLFSGDASGGGSTERQMAQQFEAARTSVSNSFIGSRPSTDGKWETWAASSAESPFPVGSFTLVLLSDLLTPDAFPTLNPVSLQVAQGSLQSALLKWCDHQGKGIACNGTAPDRLPGTLTFMSNSNVNYASYPCTIGKPLAGGVTNRNNGWGQTSAYYNAPEGVYCREPGGQSFNCNMLCTTAFSEIMYTSSTCPPGWLVASCGFEEHSAWNYPSSFPSSSSSCTCYESDSSPVCHTTCVPAAEVEGHEIVTLYSSGVFNVTCPTGKRLLGCGYKDGNTGHKEVYWAVAPVSTTTCQCYNYFGATCYAVCASY